MHTELWTTLARCFPCQVRDAHTERVLAACIILAGGACASASSPLTWSDIPCV
jgi:hypothetical protein